MTIRELKAMFGRRVNGERTEDLAREAGISESALRHAWGRANFGPIPQHRCCHNEAHVLAAIEARRDGMKWQDIPAHIGSDKTVNAIRLAVWYYQRKVSPDADSRGIRANRRGCSTSASEPVQQS